MPLAGKDHYSILGLHPNASDEEIKKSFKKLAVKYHPDKTDDKSHHELFLKINQAYEILKSSDTRTRYDEENGFKSKHSPVNKAYNYAQHFATSFAPRNPFKYGGGGASYYEFYRSTRRYSDGLDSESREEELLRELEKKREKERLAAAAAARAARERVEREQRRMAKEKKEREEAARKREKEEQMRQFCEKEAERHANELNEKLKREATRKHWNDSHPNYETKDFDEFDRQYLSSKEARMRERARARENLYANSIHDDHDNDDETPSSEGVDESNPIIVEDKSDDENVSDDEEKFQRYPPSTPNYPSSPPAYPEDGINNEHDNDDANSSSDSYASASADVYPSLEKENLFQGESKNSQTFEQHAHSNEPPGTYLNMENVQRLFSDTSMNPRRNHRSTFSRRSVSPTRNPRPQKFSNIRSTPLSKTTSEKSSTSKTKRMKIDSHFDYSELRLTLNVTDIGNVDFQDIYESLPKGPSNSNRKLSESVTQGNPKRPKVAEYLDGTSKAETLYTPINKNVYQGHNTETPSPPLKSRKVQLTESDLNSSISSSSLKCPQPPQVPNISSLTTMAWNQYVASMAAYDIQFAQYKQLIIQYQTERFQKDQALRDIINSNESAFMIHQNCLARDLDVMTDYTYALRAFTTSVQQYKQNCSWVEYSQKK